MTHWGWDDTDDDFSIHSSEVDSETDTEYFELSSSDSSFDFIEDVDNSSEESQKDAKSLLPSKGVQAEAIQRTYSNLSGLCPQVIQHGGMEVQGSINIGRREFDRSSTSS